MNVFSPGETLSQQFLSSLKGLMADAASERSARECLEAMLNRLVTTLGYNRSYLDLLDLPLKNQQISLSQGRQAFFGHLQGPGPMVTGQIMTTRYPLVLENIKDHPDFYGRSAQDQENLSFIGVPVLDSKIGPDGQRLAMGVLCVDLPKAPPVFLERQRDFLEAAAAVMAIAAMRLREELARPRPKAQPEPEAETGHSSTGEAARLRVVAVSKSMRLVMRQMEQAALADTPVLLRGEEGTGKQHLAQALHNQSARRRRPFVHLDCAAEPHDAIERSLFGVQKGEASKSTQSKRGAVELAQGGTLYIEDVEYLSPSAQQGLLRFIQEGAMERIGGDGPIPLDVRIIASCSANIEDLMTSGAFMEDLYYALNVMPIYVPPLRDRSSDVLPLAEHFLQEFALAQDKPFKRISTPAIDLINQYHWPDNVSELRACMERAFEQCEEGVIRAYHLPPTLQTAESSDTESSLSFGEAVDQFEKELLTEALKKARGNMFQAAKDLRESYRIINYKVKKHGIDPKRFTPGKRR